MRLRLRSACPRDLKAIDKLIEDYKFNFDVKHIESLLVVIDEDQNEIIAVGSLTTILESMFLTDKSKSKRSRIKALQMLMVQADMITAELKYSSYHAFTTNDSIWNILMKKFGFQPTEAKVLVKIL